MKRDYIFVSYMGIIPTSKFGDCYECGDKDVPCVKVGKNLFCRDKCHRNNKIKQQVTKANQRNKVRGLITYERQEGILDSVSELVIDCDRVISRYIRLRDREADGKITCYCCGKRVAWEKAHCMHFINRQHMATRFLQQNLRSGCFTCNVEKRGNLIVYAEKLNAENAGITEWLNEEARTVTSLTQSDLKEILFDFQQKLRQVESKLK